MLLLFILDAALSDYIPQRTILFFFLNQMHKTLQCLLHIYQIRE